MSEGVYRPGRVPRHHKPVGFEVSRYRYIEYHIQIQDITDSLECAHMPIPDSLSNLVDTHYYLDFIIVLYHHRIVDRFCNESLINQSSKFLPISTVMIFSLRLVSTYIVSLCTIPNAPLPSSAVFSWAKEPYCVGRSSGIRLVITSFGLLSDSFSSSKVSVSRSAVVLSTDGLFSCRQTCHNGRVP